MPRPWFSNSLRAYARTSPYGSMVGTDATTTTSPVAACKVRIIRSIAAAFERSITRAKSLTGWVNSGSWGLEAGAWGVEAVVWAAAARVRLDTRHARRQAVAQAFILRRARDALTPLMGRSPIAGLTLRATTR